MYKTDIFIRETLIFEKQQIFGIDIRASKNSIRWIFALFPFSPGPEILFRGKWSFTPPARRTHRYQRPWVYMYAPGTSQ